MKRFAIFTFYVSLITSASFVSFAQDDSSYVRTEKREVNNVKMPKERGESVPFQDKVFVGFYPGIQLSNVDFFIEFSPIAGYQLSPKLSLGLGSIYRYYKVKQPYFNGIGIVYPYSTNVFGVRAFSSFDIYKGFLAYGEYEAINYDYYGQSDKVRKWSSAVKLGGGYRSSIGDRAAINLLILYNFSYDQFEAAAASPWDMRVGFIFYPFKSKTY